MSMPNIPDITPKIELCRDEIIDMLLASVALEEMGLSHIINAEGEKIQRVLEKDKEECKCDFDNSKILEVNDSVDHVLDKISNIEEVLVEKLKIVKDFQKDKSKV